MVYGYINDTNISTCCIYMYNFGQLFSWWMGAYSRLHFIKNPKIRNKTHLETMIRVGIQNIIYKPLKQRSETFVLLRKALIPVVIPRTTVIHLYSQHMYVQLYSVLPKCFLCYWLVCAEKQIEMDIIEYIIIPGSIRPIPFHVVCLYIYICNNIILFYKRISALMPD